jgi:predicted nicotinamide N-methyase
MKYPVQLIELEKGFNIYVPDTALVKSTYKQLIVSDIQALFPFWAKLWASSKVLTQFLIANPKWVQGKLVLEMGAGIGQPSLTIAKEAKEVFISDHNADAVALLEKNIIQLGLTNAKGLLLDWNTFDYFIAADTILLSDINYAPEAFDPLLKIIMHYITKGAVIIIATPQRMMGIPFIKSLQPYIKESITKSIFEEETEVFISIYILYK